MEWAGISDDKVERVKKFTITADEKVEAIDEDVRFAKFARILYFIVSIPIYVLIAIIFGLVISNFF